MKDKLHVFYSLRFLFFIGFLFVVVGTKAQYTSKDINLYIETYSDLAIKKMKDYGIPASITLAQGILESAAGTSDLARNANNHFGIKCHSDWSGKTYYKDDDKKDECFRSYNSVEESYNDHSSFLKKSRYASLFTLEITDYKAWAKELKKCGYATDPNYPDRLIYLIETYSLNQFDKADYKKGAITQKPSKADQVLSLQDRKFSKVDYPYTERAVYLNNNVYFIIAKKGETFYDIAIDVQLTVGQLRKYNDVPNRNYEPQEGEIIYISKKAGNSSTVKEHVVRANETLRDIAQRYGIKEKSLRKRNNLPKGIQPSQGSVIKLKN